MMSSHQHSSCNEGTCPAETKANPEEANRETRRLPMEWRYSK